MPSPRQIVPSPWKAASAAGRSWPGARLMVQPPRSWAASASIACWTGAAPRPLVPSSKPTSPGGDAGQRGEQRPAFGHVRRYREHGSVHARHLCHDRACRRRRRRRDQRGCPPVRAGQASWLKEAARILRPGGRLVFTAFEVEPQRVEGLPVLGVDPVADYRPLLEEQGFAIEFYQETRGGLSACRRRSRRSLTRCRCSPLRWVDGQRPRLGSRPRSRCITDRTAAESSQQRNVHNGCSGD
jgi:hypothetical protein